MPAPRSIAGKGLQPTSTHYGGSVDEKSKKKGGKIPTIERQGTGRRHTSTNYDSDSIAPDRESGKGSGLEGSANKRSYSDVPNTPQGGRRIRDGVTGDGIQSSPIIHKDS